MPLAEAWYFGAYKWSSEKKKAFGNDLGYKWSLNAVTTKANRSKGAGDPADWMPAKNKCTYAKAWVAVKYRWKLSVDPREKRSINHYLSSCTSFKVLKPGKPNLKALSGLKTAAPPVAAPPTPVSAPTPAQVGRVGRRRGGEASRSVFEAHVALLSSRCRVHRQPPVY